jgi:hypothetical protein
MGRKDSPAGLTLRLRLLGRRVLATGLCLLRRRAGHLGLAPVSVSPEVRQRFGRRNLALQEELRRVFAPLHHLCPGCGSQCCREPEIPFSRLDGLLYGGPGAASPATGEEKPPSYLSCFRRNYLYGKLKQFSRGKQSQPGGQRPLGGGRSVFCPALGEAGCLLPWGERPAVCVFCACPRFLEEMTWGDYGRQKTCHKDGTGYCARAMNALYLK